MTQGSFGFQSVGDEWVAYVDGGARGNPGDAGFGVVIQDAGCSDRVEIHGYLGRQTNNYAEYRALLAALDYALSQGCRRLHVQSDSELLVRQLKGVYKVRNVGLQPLFQQAREKIDRLASFRVTHVRRENNRRADELANLAMDSKDPYHVATVDA